jgi:hypothetical protein
MKEQRIISFLRTIDFQNLNNSIISKLLQDNGFLYSDKIPYNDAQVSSLLHSLRTKLKEEFKKKNPPIDRCGIDREHNPCGDASDY